MKVAVITARFSVSGVPLAQIRLATAWQKRGHVVECVFGWLGNHAVRVSAEMPILNLGVKRTILMLPRLMKYFIENKPDIVFAAEDHLNAVVLLAAILTGSNAKISCSSRVTPFDTYSGVPLSKGWFLKLVMKSVMWRADLLTCVSKDMVTQYQSIFRGARHVCVYNIVDSTNSATMMAEAVDHEWLDDPQVQVIIGAGSLEPWKGFHDLIRAMSCVPSNARLLILGEGTQRDVLKSLIDSLDLSERVQLLGKAENPLKYFGRSDVFALSSYVEGMPNVLIEAMMCGCTPVSTDCPTGPRELFDGQNFEPLVPVGDWRALGAAISNALNRPVAKDRLAKVVGCFSEEVVMRRYLELLSESPTQ